MDIVTSNQPKHERSRTRWTAALDKILADLIVKQIQLGNRRNHVFGRKTWNHIRDEFNKLTDLNFNNNQLKKHYVALRTRFYNMKSASAQNEFTVDDSCVGFDLWDNFGAQTRPETIKVDCPIYEQLCTMFMDTSTDGKYAQSSHFEGLDESIGNDNVAGLPSCPEGGASHSENPSSSRLSQENTLSSEKVAKNVAERKRKRPSVTQSSCGQNGIDEEVNETMAEALLDMLSASKWRAASPRGLKESDEGFSITNCIKALDEIVGIDQRLYFASLDLFEDPNLRETFLSLKGDMMRLAWLQGKCGLSTVAWYV